MMVALMAAAIVATVAVTWLLSGRMLLLWLAVLVAAAFGLWRSLAIGREAFAILFAQLNLIAAFGRFLYLAAKRKGASR